MKFTMQNITTPQTQTPQLRVAVRQSVAQPMPKSRFSMNNQGRTPCMKFNKPSVHVDCGCSGGKRMNI